MTILKICKEFKDTSDLDLQYIQESIANIVILYSQSIYHMEAQANTLTIQKKLSASLTNVVWTMMHDMEQNAEKNKRKPKQKKNWN